MAEGTRGSTDRPDSDALGITTLPSTESAARRSEAGLDADPTQIGRFVVLRRIGEGGMGVVYAAYDNELDRKVAIKLVRPERAGDDESRARVRREAQAMARLSHPNVVQVYEVGEHHGQIYVAMEFVTGPTLAEWAAAHAPGPERWRAMLDKYIDAGRGLAAAHAVGLVHRDFKPANAIVGADGRVRVLDFGIARAPGADTIDGFVRSFDEPSAGPQSAGSQAWSSPLTVTGAMMGTPAYMSPEQFEQRSVDARSDQFSFCVALYEALYGERPFAAKTTAALVLAVTGGELSPAPIDAEVPSWLRALLVRGLANDPTRRWPSMNELLAALTRDPALRRRRRRRSLAIATLTLSAIAGSAWFARVQQRDAASAQALEAAARQRKAEAEAERDRALREAQAAAVRARDTARVLAARGLSKDPSSAAALLRDVEHPDQAPGWQTTAMTVLQEPLCERVLRGHEGRIVSLDVSPDDRWLVSASFDGTARIWSLAGTSERATVLAHDSRVLSARFSPDGRRVLTASADHSAALWPMPIEPGDPAGEPTLLRGHLDTVWSAEFSHDGTRVVTASRDGTARVWSVTTPDAPTVFEVSEGLVWSAEFSPDDRHIVAAASDGRAGVWSVDEPRRPAIWLEGHEASVGDAHFNGRGDLVVTASFDGSARVFALDYAAGTARETAVLDHDDDVYRAFFGPDDRRIVTVSRDRSAKLWPIDAAGAPSGAPQVFADHAGTVWSAALSEAGLLALGARDAAVEVWPLAGGPPLELFGHSADVFRVRFSNDGRRLFSGSNDGTVRVWASDWPTVGRELVTDSRQITELEARGDLLIAGGEASEVWAWPLSPARLVASEAPTMLTGHEGGVRLASSPSALTSGDGSGRVRVWVLDETGVRDPERPLELQAASTQIAALAIDPGAELLAAMLRDGSVVHWQLDLEGKAVRAGPRLLASPTGRRRSGVLAFSPDSRALVSASSDGRVLLWTRDELLGDPGLGRTLITAGDRPTHTLFSPDSQRLAVTTQDRSTRVWSLAEPERAPVELASPTALTRLAFDSSGRYLAAGGSDTTVVVWDLDPSGSPRQLSGPAGEVRDVAFAPDDRFLAAASLDGTLHVWPLSRSGGRLEIAEPVVFEASEPLHRLTILDGGRRVAAAGYGSTIHLWHLGERFDVATLRGRLEQATSLCLTVAQRMQFVGESAEAAELGYAACSSSGRE